MSGPRVAVGDWNEQMVERKRKGNREQKTNESLERRQKTQSTRRAYSRTRRGRRRLFLLSVFIACREYGSLSHNEPLFLIHAVTRRAKGRESECERDRDLERKYEIDNEEIDKPTKTRKRCCKAGARRAGGERRMRGCERISLSPHLATHERQNASRFHVTQQSRR